MRISDWSSDVCSSDLRLGELQVPVAVGVPDELVERLRGLVEAVVLDGAAHLGLDLGELADDPAVHPLAVAGRIEAGLVAAFVHLAEARGVPDLGAEVAIALDARSEEHTSELQSLMRISYAVFCLKK